MPTSKPEKKEPKKPLSVTHPELAKEADGWDASIFTAGSGRSMSWKCKRGHKWFAKIQNRAGEEKNGCPFCGNKKVLTGFNDLKTKFPDLAVEADGWDPSKVNTGTHQKYSWVCKIGHKYKVSPSQRTSRGIGCPYCLGRKVMSGFNDLLTTNPILAQQANGWDPANVSKGVSGKFSWKCEKGHIWQATIPNRDSNNSGCPICIGKKVLIGFNDLQTTHPLIAEDAVGWDPESVTRGSALRVEWNCKVGHSWVASVAQRTSRNTGCPFCAGMRVVPGQNDLATTHPEIAVEADGWDPSNYYHGSESKRNWKCPLGHKYKSSLKHRCVRGQGCPYCSSHKVLTGFNDLKTKFPHIAQEADGWDPASVASGSGKKQKWICEIGHTWQTSVSLRTSANTGCPTCYVGGYDPNQDAFLYFLQHSRWEMLQIGITNFPDQRLNNHKKLGWDVLELRGPMDGHLTQQWETAILRMLKKKGADLSNEKIAGKFDGYSEAWTKATFPVDSIKELMRLTDEFEDDLGKGRSVE